MAGVAEYSTTAASNTHVNNIDIRGTANVQNHDNGMRQIMADIATARTDGQMASMPYVAKSAGYTVAVTDRGKLIDCTAALELDLPAAATAGTAFYFIAKANGGDVTVDPNGTENINGSSTSATISDGSSAIVVCDATEWYTLTIGAGNVTTTGTQTLTNKTLTSPVIGTGIELGHASDTTLTRSAAGVMAVEGNVVPSPASQASGDVLYRGASSWSRLAKGTASQVLTMNSGATAPEWASPPFTQSFTSAETAVSNGEGLTTIAHGLGTVPILFHVVLRCKTTEGGWAVGDEIAFTSYDAPGISSLTIGANDTNVYISQSALMRICNRTDGAFDGAITAANWRWVVRAWA